MVGFLPMFLLYWTVPIYYYIQKKSSFTFPRAADVVAISKTNMSLSLFLPVAATDIGFVPSVFCNHNKTWTCWKIQIFVTNKMNEPFDCTYRFCPGWNHQWRSISHCHTLHSNVQMHKNINGLHTWLFIGNNFQYSIESSLILKEKTSSKWKRWFVSLLYKV